MTTVVLADDQDLVRTGLRALLTRDRDIEIVAEAQDGAEAVRRTRALRPDVVLMDIRMPVKNGISAAAEICADPELAGTRVVILTTFDDDEDIVDAVRAGAAGYLLKDIGSEQLREAVHTAAEGGNLLSPQIARRVMEQMASVPQMAQPDDVDLSELT